MNRQRAWASCVSALLPCIAALLLLASACSQKPTPVAGPNGGGPPGDIAAALAEAYRTGDLAMFSDLLAEDPTLPEYRYFTGAHSQCADESWGLTEEIEIHQRMFEPQSVPQGAPPVPPDLLTEGISVTLTRSTPYTERVDLYRSAQNPGGIDPDLWHVSDAIYAADLLVDMQGENDYMVTGRVLLVVVEDRRPASADNGKLSLLEWHDLGSTLSKNTAKHSANRTAAVVERSWSDVKGFYRVAPPLSACRPALSPAHLINKLEESYRSMDLSHFWSLLVQDPDLEFTFVTDATEPQVPWGRDTELAVHQRMFEPANTPPGQSPVLAEYWLVHVSITLTPQSAFTERIDLYQSAQNPDGLPQDRWRVLEASYFTDVLFDTKGALDFQVSGRASFTIVEDKQKVLRDHGKYQLLSWVDLAAGSRVASVEDKTWTGVKGLYLP